ncbi:MAG: signal recognition particle subunit SRP19/SEC65 family protein [Nitrososphaerales archaeon]
MKDYNLLILWLDYFNSNLKRSEGRRVPLNLSIKSPTLDELIKAAKLAGYNPKPFSASHPKRGLTPSGYITIERIKPKSMALREVSKALIMVRGEQYKIKP